jgi:hypothetical protein
MRVCFTSEKKKILLHQENLVFTFLTFSLLLVLLCRKVVKGLLPKEAQP